MESTECDWHYVLMSDALRTARKRLKMTQAEVGAAMGLDASQISRFESGERRPHADEIRRLADIYKVPSSEIWPGAPDEASPNSFGHPPKADNPEKFGDPNLDHLAMDLVQVALSAAVQAPQVSRDTAERLAERLVQTLRLPADRHLKLSPQDQMRLRVSTAIGLFR